jgi:hypothetical protein
MDTLLSRVKLKLEISASNPSNAPAESNGSLVSCIVNVCKRSNPLRDPLSNVMLEEDSRKIKEESCVYASNVLASIVVLCIFDKSMVRIAVGEYVMPAVTKTL